MMSSKEEIERVNREIASRFQKIEEEIPTAETIAGLLEMLIKGIEREFGVPFVWLTFIDGESAAPLIEAVKTSEALKSRYGLITQELFEKILPCGLKPVLANKELQSFYKLMPDSRKYFARSVAIAPLALGDQIIGTWNNGDADTGRYTTNMDTDLLASLAGKVSLKLTQLAANINSASVSDNDNNQSGGNHG